MLVFGKPTWPLWCHVKTLYFHISYLTDAHTYEPVLHFREKKVLKNYAKNKLIFERTIVQAKYGRCALRNMGSSSRPQQSLQN